MKSAPPIAPPGCPDLARSTIEAANMRMLSAARFISCIDFPIRIFVVVKRMTEVLLYCKLLLLIILTCRQRHVQPTANMAHICAPCA